MSWIITRMPSTGNITNISHSDRTPADLRTIWADTPAVSVYSDEQYARLPTCETCEGLAEEGRCADCR